MKVIGRPCVDVDATRGFLNTISPVDLDGSGNENSWTRFLARKISHRIFWWSQLQLLRGVVFFFKIVPRHDTSDFVLLDLANVKSNVS